MKRYLCLFVSYHYHYKHYVYIVRNSKYLGVVEFQVLNEDRDLQVIEGIE
jgi:hypothetical protein